MKIKSLMIILVSALFFSSMSFPQPLAVGNQYSIKMLGHIISLLPKEIVPYFLKYSQNFADGYFFELQSEYTSRALGEEFKEKEVVLVRWTRMYNKSQGAIIDKKFTRNMDRIIQEYGQLLGNVEQYYIMQQFIEQTSIHSAFFQGQLKFTFDGYQKGDSVITIVSNNMQPLRTMKSVSMEAYYSNLITVNVNCIINTFNKAGWAMDLTKVAPQTLMVYNKPIYLKLKDDYKRYAALPPEPESSGEARTEAKSNCASEQTSCLNTCRSVMGVQQESGAQLCEDTCWNMFGNCTGLQ